MARVCLDMLRSRKFRREEPFGDELPSVAPRHADAERADPERIQQLDLIIDPART